MLKMQSIIIKTILLMLILLQFSCFSGRSKQFKPIIFKPNNDYVHKFSGAIFPIGFDSLKRVEMRLFSNDSTDVNATYTNNKSDVLMNIYVSSSPKHISILASDESMYATRISVRENYLQSINKNIEYYNVDNSQIEVFKEHNVKSNKSCSELFSSYMISSPYGVDYYTSTYVLINDFWVGKIRVDHRNRNEYTKNELRIIMNNRLGWRKLLCDG